MNDSTPSPTHLRMRAGAATAARLSELPPALLRFTPLTALVLAAVLASTQPAAAAAKPRAVFIIGEDQYQTHLTLPEFARTDLDRLGVETLVVQEDPQAKHRFPGLRAALPTADLIVISLRRRLLDREDLDRIQAHLKAGKPLLGLRTASHAFAPRDTEQAFLARNPGKATWPEFDPEVLGGNYAGHHEAGVLTSLEAAPDAVSHPVLAGVDPASWKGHGSLYRVSPISSDTTPLLLGRIPGKPGEPVAWLRTYGPERAKIFYTSLGHPDDFKTAGFRRLMANAVLWTLGMPAPGIAAAPPTSPPTAAGLPGPRFAPVPSNRAEATPARTLAAGESVHYRCAVRPPAEWIGQNAVLRVEGLVAPYEIFWNGTRLSPPPSPNNPPSDAAPTPRVEFALPAPQLRATDWTLLVLRFTGAQAAAPFSGPAPILRAGGRAMPLNGLWQVLASAPSTATVTGDVDALGTALFNDEMNLARAEAAASRAPSSDVPKPLLPAESAKRFTVPADLEIELVLSEPEIAQPLQLSFDERGRLWVVEYRQYPAPAGLTLLSHDQWWRAVYDKVPEAPPRHVRGKDRISIHEDTNGDGRYERHTVFVDGLNIATAAAKGLGGVWVLNPPYLLFYPDRDNNDVPDGDPEVRLSGFGLEDTHSVVNSLRWGPDGWLYGAQGSTVSAAVVRPGSQDPPVKSMGQNIWRYHPESRRFEIFSEGGGNAFGLELDDQGRIFSGHNGGNTRGFHYMQGASLQKGFQKHGELSNPYAYGYFLAMPHHDVERFTHTFLIYGADALPAPYHGRLLGVEPLQGRVVLSEILPVGSSFKTKDLGYAVTSTDPWFKPVDVKTGPDGAVYIADWYDAQVNHWRNYQGNMDASNGRVYRLKTRGARTPPPTNLASLPTSGLLAQLESPNRAIRQLALRILGDRRDPSLPPLLRSRLPTQTGQTALESLWALFLSGGLDSITAAQNLSHPEPQVRLWTARLIADSGALPEPVLAAAVSQARIEPNLEVRAQYACSARRLPAAQALALMRPLIEMDVDASDPRQPLLLWWAIEAHAQAPEALLAWAKSFAPWNRPLFSDHLLERIGRRYAHSGLHRDLLWCARWIEAAPTSTAARKIFSGVELAFKGRPMANLPTELLHAVDRHGIHTRVIDLKLGRAGALDAALTALRSATTPAAEKIELAAAVGALAPAQALPALLQQLRDSTDASLRRTVLAALGGYQDPSVASVVLGLFPALPPDLRAPAATLLASRTPWALDWLRAIQQGAIHRDTTPVEVLTQLQQTSDPSVREAVAAVWPTPPRSDPAALDQKVAALAKLIDSGPGNPYRGKELYTAVCSGCHKLFNQGGDIGPDLTSFHRADAPLLLLSIVNPSAEIREGYQTVNVQTRDGRSLTGFVTEEDDHRVALRGLDGALTPIPRADLLRLERTPLSLMPEGMLDGLDTTQLRDLFAYLRSSQPLAN